MEAPASPSIVIPETGSPQSPSSICEDQALELTPRSKVKAALAALDSDNSGGEEVAKANDNPQARPALAFVSGNSRNLLDARAKTRLTQPFLDSDDSEEDVPFRPRGRLAARLDIETKDLHGTNPFDQSSDEENAYERIKRRLNPKQLIGKEESQGQENSTQTPLNETNLQADSAHPSASDSSGVAASREDSTQIGSLPRPPEDEDDEQLPDDPLKNSRFLELVAKKKAERQAKETEESRKKEEKLAKLRELEEYISDDSHRSDGETGRRFTQDGARPMRKASKKAIEEMNRETQRMERNMQLAHKATTKKKITKESFFARFNLGVQPQAIPEHPPPASSETASSRQVSDAETNPRAETPPTSPCRPNESGSPEQKGHWETALKSPAANCDKPMENGDLPELEDVFATAPAAGRPLATTEPVSNASELKPASSDHSSSKFRLPKVTDLGNSIDLDSDSDKGLPSPRRRKKPGKTASRLDAFQTDISGKALDSMSLLKLRALAHLNAPRRTARDKKATVSVDDLQSMLHKRARQQALEERHARIEELKAKGVYIATAEEREKDQTVLEDMLEKGRREAKEIRQAEKIAKKKERNANPSLGDLQDSSDEDDDYEEGVEDGDNEYSNSEDEDDGSEEAESDVEQTEQDGERPEQPVVDEQRGAFLDDEAMETEEEDAATAEESEAETAMDPTHRSRRQRFRAVIVDDEDDNELVEHRVDSAPTTTSLSSAKPEDRGAKTLFDVQPPALDGFGLTQAFAGTMANSQDDENERSLMDDLVLPDAPPDPHFVILNREESLQMIPETQENAVNDKLPPMDEVQDSARVVLDFSQSQIRHDTYLDIQSQLQTESTQLTQMPDPTQDAGFVHSSPAPERFVDPPASTVETVLIAPSPHDRTPTKRKGRFRRRAAIASDSEDDMNEGISIPGPHKRDVFAAMKEKREKAAMKAQFDKKKSNAKDMVEEQAQESEDEYAGLGGASDDGSGDEEDEEVRKMIDHEDINVDERALAALHANAEREMDDKMVTKIYKDVTTGGLRRKRGNEIDLSDSDDDAEARRRRKQREFARMRKALLADEKVGKIAEDPRKTAFLRAIEDRENDEDLDFLDQMTEDSFSIAKTAQGGVIVDSQSQQTSGGHSNLSVNEAEGVQRPPREVNPNIRAPATSRRTPATSTSITKKPANLAEIRESVSFLTEVPGAVTGLPPSPSPSASENEQEPSTNTGPNRNPRRTPAKKIATAIIDRLSLKRASSSSLSIESTTSISTTSRLAFYAPDPSAPGGRTADGFRIPSLLRRATTQITGAGGAADGNGISHLSRQNSTASSSSTENGGFGGKSMKHGNGKRCSVNFYAREEERKRAVEGVEKRRRLEKERKAVERRRGQGGLRGLQGGGGFD